MTNIDDLERLITASKIPGAPVSGATALTLIAELRALLKDTGRYRWIRDGEKDVFCVIGSNGAWGECGHQEIYDDRLDAAIDAAFGKEMV
jgi:hypothetical protein